MKRRKKKRRNGIHIFITAILLVLCAGAAVPALQKEDDILPESQTVSYTETIEAPGMAGSVQEDLDTASPEPIAPDSVQELQGTVKDATMNTLAVLGMDGCEYLFGTEDVDVSTGKTGLVIGNPVTVSYRGKLDPSLAVQEAELLSITVTDADSDNGVPEPMASDSVLELQGTIKDATMNTLAVLGVDGCEYLFGTEDVDVSTGNAGLIIGNPVTVSYRGKLDPGLAVQEAELLSITVTDADLDNGVPEPIGEPSESPKPDEPPAAAQKAQEILNGMTLEEKVGQMFIARCPETDAVQKVGEYNLGGYILFGRDFSGKTEDEIVQTVQSYQDAAQIPLFIGVDEEGGTVNRVSTNPNLRAVPFWSPQELYTEGGFGLVQSDAQEKCELLHKLGINLNFAPVCDVSQNPDDFIYDRSFGQNAEQTAAYVQLVVQTMAEEGMGSVLKHFPGYGNNADTHTGIAYDNRSYETYLDSDFLPFQAGIDSGASMVLISHNIVSCMDGQSPASLSPQVHQILREKLGFTGVIITDDLAMDGVRDFAGDTEIAVQAVLAGNDLLCCTDFEMQIPAVLEAVAQGEIAEERINESVLRILQLKVSLGII